ncbi:serpin family protein [Henriciella sp. AS95]|uniref:serpin family protein n=1 Tax=Henriciella sp. AS95 TaxID=3135782 RepID=UPI00317A9242
MKTASGCALVLALSACATPPLPYDSSPDTQSIVSANSDFGVDIYRAGLEAAEKNAAKRGETVTNFAISPASISTALAMTYAGARGETAAQMAEVLRFDLPPETLHASMASVLFGLQSDAEGQTLKVNNRIFVDEPVTVEKSFESLMKNTYKAPLERLDLRGEPEESRQHINAWVKDKTEDRIQNLIPSGEIKKCTRMVLVNTVYLDANWATPFSARSTRNEPFTTAEGNDVVAQLMSMDIRPKYLKTSGFQAVQLPYKGNQMSMVIMLPDSERGLPRLQRQLSGEKLDRWLAELSESENTLVDLKLPKIEFLASVTLGDSLSALGMPLAFSNDADFDGIADPVENPVDSCFTPMRLKLDEVDHQVFVKVDEDGTEAAAATSARMTVVVSGQLNPPTPIPFHADHPFLFVIKDNETGMVLFLGRVTDPTS